MAFTRVVLPTPGPPVITISLDETAISTAARWLSAKVTPSCCSTHGMAFSASMFGHDGWPVAKACSRSAMTFSACQR